MGKSEERLALQTMTRAEIADVLSEIEYKDWELQLSYGSPQYLQVRFFTYWPRQEQHGRKWLLSQYMTKSEIVQTALAAVLAVEEHEARERFVFRGVAVYGPHIDVEALLECSTRLDVRAPTPVP